jgi:DNA excision repair protein ERCC-2
VSEATPPLAAGDLFPYEPRPHQLELAQAVRDTAAGRGHLVVESPTGTGKTVCALAGALAATIDDKVLRVLYLTRTNAQQRQVMLELRQLSRLRRPVFGAGIQGRANMCFLALGDPELASATSEELSRLCADRKARTRDAGAKDPLACPHYARLLEWELPRTVAWAHGSLPTAPELIAYCRERGICAHEVAKELLKEAKVVTAPYIYLFSPFARRMLLEWMGCHERDLVVIVDEAHNLPDYARELASMSLTVETLRRARRECAVELQNPEVVDGLPLDELLKGLETIVQDLSDEFVVDEDGLIPPDAFSSELMGRFHLTSTKVALAARNCVTLGEIVKDQRRKLGRLGRSYVLHTGGFVGGFMDLDAEEYVKLVSSPPPQRRGEPRESWLEGYCMDPARACSVLHEVAASVHMSGTLRPLDEYVSSIGLPEGARQLALPSPFPPGNRELMFAQDLTTRFEDVQRDPGLIGRIEDRTVAVTNAVGRNTVVFFPSFALKQRFIRDGVAGRMDHRIYDEERGMPTADLEGMLDDFRAPKGEGSCLLAVVGGRVSEGLDFPGEALELAVVVGIPYPKPTAKQKAMRHYYEVRFGKGWEYAVKAPTTRKLMQSLGRLIRTPTDRGVGVVLDSRAAQFRDIVPELLPSYDVAADAARFFATGAAVEGAAPVAEGTTTEEKGQFV